jgi:hypothetical protein
LARARAFSAPLGVRAGELRNSKKPIVFYANGIGDGIVVTPALRVVWRAFQGRARFIFQDGPDRFLFNEYGQANQFIVQMHLNAGKDGRDFPLDGLQDYVKGCDLFLSFAGWTSPSLIELQNYCAAKTSVGYFSNFDICLPRSPNAHLFDTMFLIPQAIFPELQIEMFSSPPTFSLPIRAAGDDILSALRDRTCIALHPEGSVFDKSYPDASLRALVHLLLETTNASICIFGQSHGYSVFDEISERIIVFNSITLELASYLISRMSLFVGVDSCFLHMADICRVPTVGLFGPADPTVWGCRFAPHLYVRATAMNEIDAKAVAAAVRSLAGRCQIAI